MTNFCTATYLLLGAALSLGCDSGYVTCRVGAKCASGVCLKTGQCASETDDTGATFVFSGDSQPSAPDSETADPGQPGSGDAPLGTDGGQTDDGTPDTSSPMDTTPADDAPGPDTVQPGVCKPNHDSVITRDEVTFGAGLSAKFEVTANVTVSTTPQFEEDIPVWDLATPLPGDETILVDTLPLEDQWFAKDFPNADYAVPLSADSALLGVFRATDDSLLLLAVVSPEGGLFATKLEYDPPARMMAFPLKVGTTWASESTVTGKVDGLFAVASEDYSAEVDLAGVLQTPFGNFDVLRISVTLERTVGLVSTTVRTFLFASECFGTVALIRSQDNESKDEFTNASEVRRLTP